MKKKMMYASLTVIMAFAMFFAMSSIADLLNKNSNASVAIAILAAIILLNFIVWVISKAWNKFQTGADPDNPKGGMNEKHV